MSYYSYALSILIIMTIVPRPAATQFVSIPENEPGLFLFTERFNPPGTNCNVTRIRDNGLSPGVVVNWTMPERGTDGWFSFNVTLVDPLDADKNDYVAVQLVVTLQCDTVEETRVLNRWTIIVEDSRDEKPFFPRDRYRIYVPENQAKDSVILPNITAIDNDNGDVLTYSIQTLEMDKGRFAGETSVKSIGGVIQSVLDVSLTQTLDYEAVTRYTFNIIAEDKTEQKASAEVVVHVQDIQDTPPVFTRQIYSGRIPETALKGTSVTRVSAIDGDSPSMRNNISYSMFEDPSGMFEVDNVTGVISTLGHLDIDGDQATGTNGLVILIIQAHELNTSGEAQYGDSSSEVTVQIQIEDANDQPPVFSQATYSGSVRGDGSVGEIVAIEGGGYISITDQDMSPTNNRFSVHVLKDGIPWSVFEPNIKSQYVQASVLIVLKQPEALEGLQNTHVRFQIVATDFAAEASGKTNMTSSVAEVMVFVLPKSTTAPPPEPIIDLPISTADVIVFVMGFLLLLNIILTIIICCLLGRKNDNGLGLFRRNSKYYVSKRNKGELDAVERINQQTMKPKSVLEVQNPVFTSSSTTPTSITTTSASNYTLSRAQPTITRNSGSRNTVFSAASRNRCDVTLLESVNLQTNSANTGNEPNGVIFNHSNQSHRCDVTPLPANKSSSREFGNQDVAPFEQTKSERANNDYCDVVPFEKAMSEKNRSLSKLLDRVHQKLAPGAGHASDDTCDLRPLHDKDGSDSSPEPSVIDGALSNDSSFSEKTKCDVAPLIDSPVYSKSSKPHLPPRNNSSHANQGFQVENENKEKQTTPILKSTSEKISGGGRETKQRAPTVPQYITPLLPASQSQITQTGVPPVALALPLGTTTVPKDDINIKTAGGSPTVTNPVFRDEDKTIATRSNEADSSRKQSSGIVSNSNLGKQKPNYGSSPSICGSHVSSTSQLTSPDGSRSDVRDYVKAAKILLDSAASNRHTEERTAV